MLRAPAFACQKPAPAKGLSRNGTKRGSASAMTFHRCHNINAIGTAAAAQANRVGEKRADELRSSKDLDELRSSGQARRPIPLNNSSSAGMTTALSFEKTPTAVASA